MKYRAEIDGLRALAVVPVILFHAGFELFSGGFVGVDVFFVISGYLITTILIEDIENNRFSLVNFYERRARRILPALFFVMFMCFPFAWMLMLPSQMKAFSQSIVAVSLFASNMLFNNESGYFDASVEEKPLLHTWSLAVEEQYYIVFPIFLLLAWRFGKNKVFYSIILLAAISLALSELGWGKKDYVHNFYLTPSRLWELLAGSITAFIIQKRGVQPNNTLSLVGLAAILLAIFTYDKNTPFPSMYTLVPVIGVVLFVLFGEKKTFVAKILGKKIFVGIGLISYSAYLWHQPLFAFTKIKMIEDPSVAVMIIVSLLSFLLAFISWKFIEKPFRKKHKNYYGRKIIFTTFALCAAIIVVIGYIGNKTDGFKFRFDRALLEGDVNHLEFHKLIDEKYIDCQPQSIAKNALYWEEFLRCKQTLEGESDWILLGDSHAEHLFLGLANSNPDKNIVFYIFDGKPYFDDPQFKDIYELLLTTSSPKLIFLTMHFVQRIVNSNELYKDLTKNVMKLQKFGHKVVLLGDIPRYQVHPEDCVFAPTMKISMKYCSMPISEFKIQKAIFDPTLKKIANENKLTYIPLDSVLCDEGLCSMINELTILYRDTNHLNIPGSQLIGSYISKELNSR